MSFQEILDSAQDLPIDLRLELLDALARSIHLPIEAEIENAWNKEIANRINELDAGTVSTVAYTDLINRLKRKVESWK